MSLEDEVTKFLRDLGKVLLAQHPVRLAVCVFSGIVLQGTISIVYSAFPDIVWLKAATELWLLFYIAVAVVAGFWRAKPAKPQEAIQQDLLLLEELIAKGNLSQSEKRDVYRKYIQICMDQFKTDLKKPEVGASPVVQTSKDPQIQ